MRSTLEDVDILGEEMAWSEVSDLSELWYY